jgi:Ca-activated chloride channel family protein
VQWIALIIATAGLAAGMGATAPAAEVLGLPGSEPTGQPTFRGGVEAVTVSVTVRDRRGRVITDLRRHDFTLFEDGLPKAIRDFYPGESAVSLAVLLDISGSMAVGGNMDRAREAVNTAVSHLQNGRDEAALYTFDSELQEVRAFTSDLSRVAAVSLEGTPWGTTSLFDAIDQTARRVGVRPNRHRAVLVVTDGVDTGSRMTASEVSGAASVIDVPVYLLVVANPVDNPGRKLATLSAGGLGASAATLADLARWTGGDMAIVSDRAESSAALKTLMSELRQQYLITFEPSIRPGWHPLEVRTERKHLTVHARSGYFAGPAQPLH